MSEMRSILLTGANRGIGLGLVKQLLNVSNPPKKLLVTCRNPTEAEELNDLKEKHSNLHVLELDVTNFESFDDFAKQVEDIVQDDGLNVLFNNAGVAKVWGYIAEIEANSLLETFQTNVMGTLLLTKALLPLIQKAAQKNCHRPYGIKRAAIINMSSIAASMTSNDVGGFYAYRVSKVAVNAATKSFSVDLKGDKILCVAMHPGWVQTDMGGSNAPMDVEESCSQMVATIYGMDESHNGAFIQYDGEILPL